MEDEEIKEDQTSAHPSLLLLWGGKPHLFLPDALYNFICFLLINQSCLASL